MYSRLACFLILFAFAATAGPAPDPRTHLAQEMVLKGQILDASRLLRDVYEDAKKNGVDDAVLANAAAELAGAYIFLDRYSDALPLLEEAIRLDRKAGPDSPNAAKHSVVLSKLYISQGKCLEAENLLRRAEPILEGAYGPESSQVAGLMNQLGLAYDMLDRPKQAIECYRRSISIYEKQGDRHRSLLAVAISNIVSLMIDQGEYDEALRMSQHAVEVVERTYGPDHPYTARALHNVGTAYQAKGKMDEARKRYELALAIWEKHPGVGALDQAAAQCSLAAVLIDEGYFSRAEELLTKATSERERILGPVSAELASGLNNLAVLYAKQNRLTDAKKALERALTIGEQTLGAKHARIVPVLVNLGWIYYAEGRYNKNSYIKAEAIYRRVLSVQEARLGPDRIEVSDALSSLAEICAKEKKYREARQLEGRALAIRQALLGTENPLTQRTQKQYTFLLRKSKE